MKIFHGSNVEVSKPRIIQNGFYKDFGYGFYCTNIEKQAKRWAFSKKGNSVVSTYLFAEDKRLNIKKFSEMCDEWLDFVAECRNGIEHQYDIVEGPMADDQIWNYVEAFIENRISRDAFWQLAGFAYPTHQIVFCNDAALGTITFEGSYKL